MNQIRIARSTSEMEALKSTWDYLYTAGQHTLFQQFKWNELAARLFAGREEPYVVLAETGNGLAIVPAAIDLAKKQLTLLGECLFDYRECLSEGDPEALRYAWIELAELGIPFVATAIRGVPQGIWSEFSFELFSGAPHLMSYQIAGKHKRLRSHFRKLLAASCIRKVYSGGADEVVSRMYQLKAMQSERNLFRDPLRIQMVCAMARQAGPYCEVHTLEHNGDLVASILSFREAQWRRFYGIYFDERWAIHSPGMGLLNELIHEWQSQGMHVDFMTGNQPYKLRLATDSTPLYTIRASVGELRRLQPALAPAA